MRDSEHPSFDLTPDEAARYEWQTRTADVG
jgi:hypothetical protein